MRVSAVCLALVLALASGAVNAREAVVGMSERAFKLIGEAQKLVDDGAYDEARARLAKFLEGRSSAYEKAHAHRLIGFTWYEQDKLDRAKQSYQTAMSQERIPESMKANLLLILGQINLVQENYKQSEQQFNQLLRMEGQDTGNNRVLLASAYMGLEQYDKVVRLLKRVLAKNAAEATPTKPRENWLSMLASAYYELEKLEEMRNVMRQLISLYPREQYLMNLAALHGQLGETDRQLALLEALADDGRLVQAVHKTTLANLLMALGRPYKAAVMLEREMAAKRLEKTQTNLELLSQAYYDAADHERAIAPLQEAADMAKDGELYLRLARLHLNAYQWDDAERTAGLALKKGGLRREGQAWLVQGMASVRLNQLIEARRQLEKARQYDDTERYAAQWLQWVESETKRKSALRRPS